MISDAILKTDRALSSTPLFAGGGTGGHIYPLLALLETLPDPGGTILVTGSRPVERKILKGYPYPWIRLPWKRVVWNLPGVFRFFWNFLLSFLKTIWTFLFKRPSMVITTAGYLGIPVALSAFLFRSPLVLIEPNMIPGKSAKLLQWIASRIVTLDSRWVRRRIPVLEGVPVRRAFLTLPSPRLAFPARILIVGGSQGAELFNRILPRIFTPQDPFMIFHILGQGDEEEVRSRYAPGVKVELIPYAEKIWELMGQAHLVIARAGASTLAELIASRRPAVLVPFPFAGAHQKENARFFAEHGGGIVVEEGDGFRERIRQAIFSLLDSRRYEQVVASMERIAYRYDSERIARWLNL